MLGLSSYFERYMPLRRCFKTVRIGADATANTFTAQSGHLHFAVGIEKFRSNISVFVFKHCTFLRCTIAHDAVWIIWPFWNLFVFGCFCFSLHVAAAGIVVFEFVAHFVAASLHMLRLGRHSTASFDKFN